MSLALYIAKWGWASFFVLTWLKIMDWWAGPPSTLLIGYVVFAIITGVSTGIYIYCVQQARYGVWYRL